MRRITQAYISKSIADFAFLEWYQMNEYYDSEKPCLFIGQYRKEDWQAVLNHKSDAICIWTGMDSKYCDRLDIYKMNHVKNITWHVNLHRYISDYIKIDLIDIHQKSNDKFTGIYGNKIFAYCPSGDAEYHNENIIKELIFRGYDIIIGDGSIPQSEWHSNIKYEVYNKCYIGLVLNNYAGGLQTILELKAQGKYCITNAAFLDNCIPWNNIEDIIQILESHKNNQKEMILKNPNEIKNDPYWMFT